MKLLLMALASVPESDSMSGSGMSGMMDGWMMAGCMILGLLVLVALVLAIFALIKYLRGDRRPEKHV